MENDDNKKRFKGKTEEEIANKNGVSKDSFDFVGMLNVLKEMMAHKDEFIETQRLLSEARMIKFQQLQKAGFTEQQALTVVAKSGLTELL